MSASSPPPSPRKPLRGDVRSTTPSIAPTLKRLSDQTLSSTPLELQLLGRTLLHAALVGVVVGMAGSLFVVGLELAQTWLLEAATGYVPLRTAGEPVLFQAPHTPFRPWLLVFVPALGALAGGLLSRLAPEIRGGGGNAIILAYHQHDGVVRRRVPLLKMLASMLTLGTGGSGGREGPTLQVGGAIGSILARGLKVTTRERRILLVAGAAAGMAAVFRTPLGAALLAVEVLHRDDFESDALVPAVLASVTSYSVFVSFFGEANLFAHPRDFPFHPGHLPLYALMSLGICLLAAGFVRSLRTVERFSKRLPLPEWSHPAVGGLGLGVTVTAALLLIEPILGRGHGLGLLGGGYGLAQVAITGADWLPGGWSAVGILLLLGTVKALATALTVGTGGSAGDFGPSLVLGGIFGGAFGRTAALLFQDPSIDPGAFALVGMGTFYGGLAHVPIGALVMVCELAGSYDLLVPLMLSEGIAFLALRKVSLYPAQAETRRDSPAHRGEWVLDVLQQTRVEQVLVARPNPVSFALNTKATDVLQRIAASEWQDAFPVLNGEGALVGVISSDILRTFTLDPELEALTLAIDLMRPPALLRADQDLHSALEVFLAADVRELVVVDDGGNVIGFLDEADITQAYHLETRGRD